MANLLGWLGKRAKGVEAQLNPFDRGATYNTVLQNRAPAPRPAPPQTAGFSQRYSPQNVAGGVGQGANETLHLIGRLAQGFPRGIAELEASAHLIKPGNVPHPGLGQALLGKQPIQTSTQSAKNTVKGLPGHKNVPTWAAVPLGVGLSSPVGPGRAGKVATSLPRDVKAATSVAAKQAAKQTAGKGTTLPLTVAKPVSAVDKAFRSTRSIIERQGPAGKTLANTLQKSRASQEIHQADILRQLPTATSLKGKKFAAFVDSVEGRIKPPNTAVAKAVGEWRTVAPEIRQRAVSAGVDVGNLGPTYYPHHVDYDKLFKNRNDLNVAINHMVSSGQAKTPEDALNVLGRARDVSRNRRMGNLEASRIADIPIYDKTRNSLQSYVAGATNRIAQAEHFGPQDQIALNHLTDIGRQGGDTRAATDAFNIAVGAKRYSPTAEKYANRTRGAISTSRLGLGAITNAGQSINTGVVTGHLRTMRAMIKQLHPQDRAFVQKTGTISDQVIQDIKENVGFTGRVFSRITAPGFGKVEKFNRSVAAVAGRDYARSLASRGRTDILRDRLGVTGTIGKKLTPDQEIEAARKVVEKTQFKVDSQDLPGWASSPGGKLVAQFRTFSYNQSKFFSNEILKPAAKGNILPLSRLLAALPVGYAIYDTKRRLNARPEQNSPGRRGLEAFSSAGGAGLAMDVFRGLVPLNNKSLTAERRVSMAAGTFGGPAVGTAVEGVGAVSNALPKSLGGASNPTQLGRFGLRATPVVGTRLQNTISPYQSQAKDQQATQATQKSGNEDIKNLRAKPPKGYSLQKTSDGRFAYTLDNGKVQTTADLSAAQRAIRADQFKKSSDKEHTYGDTYYYKTKTGAVRSMPAGLHRFNVFNAKNKLTMDRSYESGDIKGWLKAADDQYQALEKKKSLYDPQTESDKIDAITLAQENLKQKAETYATRGYTKRGTGVSKRKPSVPSFKTATAKLAAPRGVKITAKKPPTFKAPTQRKLAVSKIPTSYKGRKA